MVEMARIRLNPSTANIMHSNSMFIRGLQQCYLAITIHHSVGDDSFDFEGACLALSLLQMDSTAAKTIPKVAAAVLCPAFAAT